MTSSFRKTVICLKNYWVKVGGHMYIHHNAMNVFKWLFPSVDLQVGVTVNGSSESSSSVLKYMKLWKYPSFYHLMIITLFQITWLPIVMYIPALSFNQGQ